MTPPQRFTTEQQAFMLKLARQNKSYKDITVLFNAKFKLYCTMKQIAKKVQELCKNDFTIETDKIIVNHVKKNPGNLSYAFEISANEINDKFKKKLMTPCTAARCSGRYYSFIRRNYIVTALGSDKGFIINRKNAPIPQNRKPPKLTPVMMLLKEIINLNEKDRKDLITFLNAQG